MKRNDILKLASTILLCETAGIIGSFSTAASVKSWYPTLMKPDFNPPSWLFGPVWVTLYAMMGVALFLVWKKGIKKDPGRFAFWFFIVHLFVNASWSLIFFGLQSPLFALVVIAVLWQMIAVLLYHFYRINKIAGLLLVPYFLWVSFATVLNSFIWTLNP